MTLFSDNDIEPRTLRTRYELECKTEVNRLDAAARLKRLQGETRLPHPGAAIPPNANVDEDSVFNWIIRRSREGDTANAESDIEDTKDSAKHAEINSEEGSGEYEEAFEDVGKCPACEHEGPLYQLCTYCEHPKLRYLILVATDDYGLNETDEEHEAAIASAEAYSRNIAAGAQGVILSRVEVKSSTNSDEIDSDETNQLSQNDWAEVHQVGNEEQKVDKWLIDSGASVHVMIQKEDLWDPKDTTHAVTIGSKKSMAVKAIGNKPTKLCDTNGN